MRLTVETLDKHTHRPRKRRDTSELLLPLSASKADFIGVRLTALLLDVTVPSLPQRSRHMSMISSECFTCAPTTALTLILVQCAEANSE